MAEEIALNLGKFRRQAFTNGDGSLTRDAAMELETLFMRVSGALGPIAASDVKVVPVAGISSDDVQAALQELDAEKADAATITGALAGKQPLDATLTAVAGASTAANKLIYWTGVDVAAVTDFTAFARTLLDDSDAITMRGTLGLGTLATQNGTFSGTHSGTSSGTNTGDQTITLTGDVTGSGAGSFAATIPANTVTYARMQDVSAASVLLGRGSAAGAGDPQEITLGSGLTMTGTTLSAAGGASVETPLANVTLAVAGTSLPSGTFAAKKNLRIRVRLPGYAGSDTASFQFNGAAGTAYRYRWWFLPAGSVTPTAGLVAASTDRIKIASANTTNSRVVECIINNDPNVTEKLVAFTKSLFGTGSAGTQATDDSGNGAWISGASTQITSVSLISSSNMNIGTQMTISGWD